MPNEKPNIIYIHSHDTGRYVQPYGYAIPTPNIQKFAEQGVLFRKAFNAAPQCSPSRAALLSGQWPHSCGMFGLVNRGFELPDCSKLLEHTLKNNGYHTVLCGIQHVVYDASRMSYDELLSVKNSSGEEIAEDACDFLRNVNNNAKNPFFLSVGFAETHRPFPELSSEDNPDYCIPMPPLPDTKQTREDMAAYRNSAMRLDEYMGMIFNTLDKYNLTENTLVICTTDHGPAFPAMKCNLTDHGIGVMLIMRWPAGFKGGRCVDAMVSQIDLFPTICDLLSIIHPEWLQGRSFAKILEGKVEEINEEIYAEQNYHCIYEPMRCIRTHRWKYIYRPVERDRTYGSNCDPSPSKELWLKNGWLERHVDSEQLYDLMFDPNEACNLAYNEEYKHVLNDMKDRLKRWMLGTNDPLLKGEKIVNVSTHGIIIESKPDDIEPQDVWNYTQRRKGYS